MPISLPTNRFDTPAERQPGDFARHPKTGAPYVTDPTSPRKRQGLKADLLAAAAAEGVDVPDGATVADLHDLLGPEPGVTMFGRPSSLGKQIENTSNLQKWSERAVALGILLDADLLAPLRHLDPGQLNLDDDAARDLLDAVAVKAKRVARSGIAAERGTHTHALTEDVDLDGDWLGRADAGEDLGIPREAQKALLTAWQQMLDANELEILAVEAPCVDDEWRQAGTLDRIARLGKDLRFVVDGGEVVTLPAGTVIVLDVKTGALKTYRGVVQYWAGYAVQIASYAQSQRYDPDTGKRSDWEWPIEQRWAIIAHLDVLAAIAGEARCRLVLVDLEAGREAGERCVWARGWEKRTDVFSLVGDDDATLVTVAVDTDPDPVPAPVDDFDAPILAAKPTADPAPAPAATKPTLQVLQPPTQLPPALCTNPDPGDVGNGRRWWRLDHADLLRAKVYDLDDAQKAWMRAVVAETITAGVSIHMGKQVTARALDICTGLVAFATAFICADQSDTERADLDEIVRAATVTAGVDRDAAFHPAHTLGAVVGSMNADQAEVFSDVVAAAADLSLPLAYASDGRPVLAAPAA